MDENVMRILQLLQEGKISAQEAETLIAALRGETAPSNDNDPGNSAESKQKSEDQKSTGGKFDLGFNVEDFGKRISEAFSKVHPEKIVERLQAQFRTASRAGAQWSSSLSAKVRTWADGSDQRPSNPGSLPELSDTHQQEFHLEPGAHVSVDNPLGDITIVGVADGPASVTVKKTVWGPQQDNLKSLMEQINTALHGTDTQLEIKMSAPEMFRDGTVDVEIHIPRNAGNVRAVTRFGKADLSDLEGGVEVSTSSGEVILHGVNGEARSETLSGAINLSDLYGMTTVATQSGDIKAERLTQGLVANSASGDVNASDIEGERIECRSVSGDVHIERAGLQSHKTVKLESISGDVSMDKIAGALIIKAVSGDLKAEELDVESVQVQTISGDVSLGLTAPFSGSMNVHTVSGDIIIKLPEGSSVRASVSATSGSVHCEQNAHEVTSTDTFWSGSLGEGTGTLNIHTVSGDASIARADSSSTGESNERNS